MVVGHQHLQAQRLGAGDAFEAGNAVVHGDEYVGAAGLHALGNRRGQAVAVKHPVGHQVADMLCAQQLQAAQSDGAGGGAVAVVVGDHADFFAGFNGLGQQPGGFAGSPQRVGRQQFAQAVVEIVHRMNTARCKELRQQGVNAALLQRPDATRRHVADLNFHGGMLRHRFAIEVIAVRAVSIRAEGLKSLRFC